MSPRDIAAVFLPPWTSDSAQVARWSREMDEVAFRAFYAQSAPRLMSYIRRASRDAALAEDILQEAFFRFLRADLPCMENGAMKAYLYRIANSLLADHWRRIKREKLWGFAIWNRQNKIAQAESETGAMAVFERLKPQEQSLLWLAYVEGFDHREIAAALQLREKSIRVLLFRARKRLAQMLGKQECSSMESL